MLPHAHLSLPSALQLQHHCSLKLHPGVADVTAEVEAVWRRSRSLLTGALLQLLTWRTAAVADVSDFALQEMLGGLALPGVQIGVQARTSIA